MKKSTAKKIKIKGYLAQLLVFTLTIAALAVTGLIIPLRPAYSESEKRNLAEFPSFSFESFFSGNYFHELGNWYSDTYPGRESLVGFNSKFKSMFGINDAEIHGEVVAGDDIPDEYVPPEETEPQSEEKSEPETEEYIVEDVDTQSLGAVFVMGDIG